MRSPQTIGDALPRPGIATFHFTFFVVDHSVGGFPFGATPVASGPRHWCQLSSFCSLMSAAQSVTAQSKTARKLIQVGFRMFSCSRSELLSTRCAVCTVPHSVAQIQFVLSAMQRMLQGP